MFWLSEIPKQNIELHKIRCNQSKGNEKLVTRNNSSESKSTKKTKSKKKEARMKEEDDIDKLLESFNKLDNICNAEKILDELESEKFQYTIMQNHNTKTIVKLISILVQRACINSEHAMQVL